jgi:DNA-binding NarL/FixJ family response regulator
MRVTGFLRLVRPIETRETRRSGGAPASPAASILSEKELAVAMLAARGLLNKEIAEKVFLSESRVKTCLSGIYRKLSLSDKDNKRELLAEILKC